MVSLLQKLTLKIYNCRMSRFLEYQTKDTELNGWHVYDNVPNDTEIKVIFDDDYQGNVISLNGNDTQNGYSLSREKKHDTGYSQIQWDSKFSESNIVYIGVETNKGFRYLTYYPNKAKTSVSSHYINHYLNEPNIGQWKTTQRDLVADLKSVDPELELIEIQSFLIRGTGLVGNIKLSNEVSAELIQSQLLEKNSKGEIDLSYFNKTEYISKNQNIFSLRDNKVNESAYNSANILSYVRYFENQKTNQYFEDVIEQNIAKFMDEQQGSSVSRSFYDNFNHLIYSMDSESYVTQYKYDAANNMVSEIKFANKLTEGTELNVEKLKDKLQTSIHDESKYFVYNSFKNLRFIIDNSGSVTEYLYNSENKVIQENRYLARLDTSLLDNSPSVTEMSLLMKSIEVQTKKYAYNGLGNLSVLTHADGSEVNYKYNSHNELIEIENAKQQETKTLINQAGLKKYTINPEGSVLEYIYDLVGREIGQINYYHKLTNPSHINSINDLLNVLNVDDSRDLHEWSILDSAGNVHYEIDALGYVTEYRTSGQLLSNNNPTKTEYNYHIKDIIKYDVKLDLNTIAKTELAIKKALDEMASEQQNWATFVWSQINRSRQFFDKAENLIYQINAEGYVVEYHYDLNNNLISQIVYGQKLDIDLVKNIDELKLLLVGNNSESSIINEYDGNNRLVYQKNVNGSLEHVKQLTYNHLD